MRLVRTGIGGVGVDDLLCVQLLEEGSVEGSVSFHYCNFVVPNHQSI
jgi:hypothetical protein